MAIAEGEQITSVTEQLRGYLACLDAQIERMTAQRNEIAAHVGPSSEGPDSTPQGQ